MQNLQTEKTLYDQDFFLWTEDVVSKLKKQDFEHLDLENLIEEIESLGKSQQKEIKSRLRVLLSHLLKRMYVDIPDCFDGWENTIKTQRADIEDELQDMPSLKRFWNDFFTWAWRKALFDVRLEYEKKGFHFPDEWPFDHDIDTLLTTDFWKLL
ncbi:MAG: DUF29 domain-containing protein [Microcystaceae cyanobacterium]